jgi:CheY-like chemotaxis protein
MPDGGTIILSAATETVGTERFHPTWLKAGRYVRLSVNDSGIGMTPATASRAAEPFFTTKPPGSGTGLGLSLARNFAEQSGGALAIESAFGRGTTVVLWLPVAEASETDPGRTVVRNASTVTRPNRRVLLVDDEAMVLDTLGPGLESAGFSVLVAANGPKALVLLDAGQPVDVLVSDLAMPGMDGVTLIRKARARRRGLPAMILTGHTAWGEAIAAENASGGAISVLGKPITAAHLAESLELKLSATPIIARETLGVS